VPHPLWTREIEGHGAELLVHRATGHLVVSTRRVEKRSGPGGLDQVLVIEPGQAPVYTNQHAHRATAFDRDGGIVWERDGLRVVGEAPDGTLVAMDDLGALVILDGRGGLVSRREVGGAWELVGWDGGGEMLLAGDQAGEPDAGPVRFPPGTVWVDGAGYALLAGELHRLDGEGAIVDSTPIPEEPFRARWAEAQSPPWPDSFVAGDEWALVHDRRRQRLLATSWALPAWTMAIGLDGAVEWVALMGTRCCNFRCLVLDEPDVLVHGSSCGQRLSFMTPAGEIFRRHDVQHPIGDLFAAGPGRVAAALQDWGVMSFDGKGDPGWAVETAGTREAISDGDVLYLVSAAAAEGLLAVGAHRTG
jgi:hypothetical protein